MTVLRWSVPVEQDIRAGKSPARREELIGTEEQVRGELSRMVSRYLRNGQTVRFGATTKRVTVDVVNRNGQMVRRYSANRLSAPVQAR